METSITARASLDASHSIPELVACSRTHGHHWDIFVTVTGDLDQDTGWPLGSILLPTQLNSWVAQSNGKDLDEMLPAITSSPIGIAMAVLEGLLLRQPRITKVRVVCSDGTEGEVLRPLRQL